MNPILRNFFNIQKHCIGCMPAFTSGDYAYLNENYDIPKNHLKIINLQEPEIIITSPMKLLR